MQSVSKVQKKIDLSYYDFKLPDDLIALKSPKVRSNAKMLVSDLIGITDSKVSDFSTFLESGDIVVFNDTKVIPARINGYRPSRSAMGQGSKISATLLEEVADGIWSVLLRPKKRIKDGDLIKFFKENQSDVMWAKVKKVDKTAVLLEFKRSKVNVIQMLNKIGSMPIPPYVEKKRGLRDSDFADYQTTFGTNEGAVAAPTASLHFDERVFRSLKNKGVETLFITLHVGAGTFLPITESQLSENRLHKEYGKISQEVAFKINEAKSRGNKIIAVGTTVLRLLESAANSQGKLKYFDSSTELMITPGYDFKICNLLLTNFHLPKSSLLMLVSAFHGYMRTKNLYRYAIDNKYRFYSFGDCMLISQNF